MPESPIQAVPDATVDSEPRVLIAVDWRSLAKKTAAYTAAALVGAGLYALATRETDSETDDVVFDATPELAE